jgi:NADH-quinone oxidoreductase subunit M
LLGLGPAGWPRFARSVACLAAGLPLALAAVAVACFNPTMTVADGNYGAQFIAHAPLVRALGVEYFVGVDGLSVLLLLLAPVVGVASVALTRSLRADGDARGPLAALLVAQAGATGVFVALDGVLLWLFWLLAVAGVVALETSHAPAASRRGLSGFARPGLASAVLLLLALAALHGEAGATYLCDGTPVRHTFDLLKMTRAHDFVGKGAAGVFGLSFATIVWVGLFVAFALALGVPPFGARAADDARGAASWALLVGVVSKMGLYGLARFNLGLLPGTTSAAAPALATFGVVAAVIEALLATRAPDLRRLLARSGAAQTALGVVGLAALTPTGISGALAVALAGGLTVALALAVLVALDGRALSETPARLAPWVAFALLASLAAPGLATFVGPVLIVVDASTRHPALAFVALAALVVGAGAHARLLRPVLARMIADQRRGGVEQRRAGVEQRRAGVEIEGAPPFDRVSLAVVVLAAVLLVALGLVPALALDKAASGVLDLVHLVTAAPG